MDFVTATVPSLTVWVSPHPLKVVTIANISNVKRVLPAVIAMFIGLPSVKIFLNALIAAQINSEHFSYILCGVGGALCPHHRCSAQQNACAFRLAGKLRIRQQ